MAADLSSVKTLSSGLLATSRRSSVRRSRACSAWSVARLWEATRRMIEPCWRRTLIAFDDAAFALATKARLFMPECELTEQSRFGARVIKNSIRRPSQLAIS